MVAEVVADPAVAGAAEACRAAALAGPVPSVGSRSAADAAAVVAVPEVEAVASSLIGAEVASVVADAVVDRDVHVVAAFSAVVEASVRGPSVPALAAEVGAADVVAVVIVEVRVPLAGAEVA